MSKEIEIPAWRQHMRRHMSDVSSVDEAEPLVALRSVRDALHADLAEIATPLVNRVMQERDGGDIESRRALCTWTNETLKSLGLAVRCPRTGRPSLIVANSRDRSDWKGRFRFDTRTTDGGVTRTITSSTLPEVQLMPDTPRQEGLARGKSRSDDGQSPSR